MTMNRAQNVESCENQTIKTRAQNELNNLIQQLVILKIQQQQMNGCCNLAISGGVN